MKFIGRKDELAALEREYKRESGFVVIYGRRRVGKTTLIKQFIKDKKALYFLTSQESSKQNMGSLTAKIARFTGKAYLENARLENWEQVFRMFAEYEPEQKKILIIDEFQYLVKADPAFPSIFQNAWDEILKDRNVMVILCGSHISMMTSSVLSHSSPLYGRRTAQIRLRPLRFTEFSMAFENVSFEERVKIYSVTGGVPKYIEFFDNDETLEKNIVENVLDRSGFLSEEPSFLLNNEVKETSSYFSILKAISMGNHRISDIATVLEQKTNELSPYLATLIELFLLEKRVPITENNPEKSRKGLYYINDNFIEFWFKFVYPYKGELELDNIEFVTEKLRSNFIDNHVSFVFEQVSRELLVDMCRNGKIDFNISRIGSYWNSNTEIDVVAIDEQNKRLLAGECKFYEKPVGMRVYSELLKKCESISEFKNYEVVHAIFSKSGFDKRLEEVAKESNGLILINGENLV